MSNLILINIFLQLIIYDVISGILPLCPYNNNKKRTEPMLF